MKRVLIISDLHSGHRAGLTPPDWQYPADAHDEDRAKFAELQRRSWEFYTRKVDALQPIDILIVNGDCIEGKGERSGGTELLELDREKQADIAAQCIEYVKAKDIVMTYGTPYHTGVTEDFERGVAATVNAKKIGGHEWVDVNGLVFDVKHKISSSIIPHGRSTASSRDVLWNFLWAMEEGQPRGRVFIRSHVHYFNYAGTDKYLAIITPALQGGGSKYGIRQCSGIVNFGVIRFDVESEDKFGWTPHLMNIVGSPSALITKL